MFDELIFIAVSVAKQFSSRVIPFVLQRLEVVNNEKVRIAALSIVRHLVNAAGMSFNILYFFSFATSNWILSL